MKTFMVATDNFGWIGVKASDVDAADAIAQCLGTRTRIAMPADYANRLNREAAAHNPELAFDYTQGSK